MTITLSPSNEINKQIVTEMAPHVKRKEPKKCLDLGVPFLNRNLLAIDHFILLYIKNLKN